MMNKKINIGVIMGGPSTEHDVSLKTGENVLKFLDKERYDCMPILISKKGKWSMDIKDIKNNFDILFLALHGTYGEDGTIQKILDKNKIRYTGSSAKASKIGMDKSTSSKVFKCVGLNVPDFINLKGSEDQDKLFNKIKKFIKKNSYPLIIKPTNGGSSVGMKLINNNNELAIALKKSFRDSENIVIQKYIQGREFTCGVLEIKKKEKALLPTEILPKNCEFFDYEAKYQKGACREVTPPHNITKKELKEIQAIALVAHKSISAKGYSRTDLIMDKNGVFWILEINTLPGLTSTSLLPQQAKAVGIEFKELLNHIIKAI